MATALDVLRIAAGTDPVARAQSGRARALIEERFGSPSLVRVTSHRTPPGMDPLRSLASRLLAAEADAVVYPVAQLPASLPRGLAVGAIFGGPSFYRCLSAHRPSLSVLRGHAKVLACDATVRAQILHRYPRLLVETALPSDEILDGLVTGAWDAACVPPDLTASDLAPFELREQRIDAAELLPAVGLGLTSVIVREAPSPATELIGELNDEGLVSLLLLERAFLAQAPDQPNTIRTATATRTGDEIRITGLIADSDGKWLLLHQSAGPIRSGTMVAREVAETCRDLASQRAIRSTESRRAE